MSGAFKDDDKEYHNCDSCDKDFCHDEWIDNPSVVSDEGDFCEDCANGEY